MGGGGVVLTADLCTGSGAIAACVAKEVPGARVVAVEISETAASLARENCERLVPGRVEVIHADATDPDTDRTTAPTPVLVHNNGDACGLPPDADFDGYPYRAPPVGQPRDHLNPDDFLDLDMTASLGSRGVAGSFVGLDDYQKGIIKFELPPEYLVELKKYIHGYPKIPGGWELTLPHHEIERFNEMIVSSEWIPLIDAGYAGIFTFDGEQIF